LYFAETTPKRRTFREPSENCRETARVSRLRQEDRKLVAEWCAQLAATGMAPSIVVRVGKRVRGFAEVAQTGLLAATGQDVAAFAVSRARRLHTGYADPLKATLRGRSLRETVKALRDFYAWASSCGLVDPRAVPTTGLRLPPPGRHRRSHGVGGRPYDSLLHVTGPVHYRAIVWLLALGVEPREILWLMPTDFDFERREARLAKRTMPLTGPAVAALRPWVEQQRFHGAQWLFPGRRGGRASRFMLQHAVRRLAARGKIRGPVSMIGFRALSLERCVRRGIAADCVPDLLGVPLPPQLRSCVAPTRERLHRELFRVTRRWRRWIG
jgi:hypothetical protein